MSQIKRQSKMDQPTNAQKAKATPAQKPLWSNYEQFWKTTIKNGSPLVKEALKAHIKALGHQMDQSKWLSDAQHFGIAIEK
jgi:hypothetical protein